MTDPANAGIQFTPDPGPLRATGIDFFSLSVINFPGWLRQDEEFQNSVTTSPLTNIRGSYIFSYNSPAGIGGNTFLLTEVLPEPGTLALFSLGLAGLGLTRPRKT